MKKLLLALVFSALATYANAATCFWVGGTGTWSTANTASWASATGGTAGTCAATGGVPKQAADTATFDGSSGGGTVTVDSTINGVTLTQITMGAFTGTLDFSANNPSITLTSEFSITGSGTRTLNLGSGAFTLSGTTGTVFDCTTVTGLTFNAGTSTIALSATLTGTRVFSGCSKTFSTITVAQGTNSSWPTQLTGNVTVGSLALTAPMYFEFGTSNTITISNSFTWAGTGTTAQQLLLRSTGSGPASGATVAVGSSGSSIAWAGIFNITFTTNAITATNSFDFGSNSGITINPPVTVSGGGHIIGG